MYCSFYHKNSTISEMITIISFIRINQIIMSLFMYSTPSKLLAQSQASQPSQSNYQVNMTPQQLLDSIQAQIKDIQSKLIAIKTQKQGISSASTQYLSLEQQRKQLKKELIDLDYQHQRYYELVNQSQNKQLGSEKEQKLSKKDEQIQQKHKVTQAQQSIQEKYLDYSRKVQEQLQKIQLASRARQEQLKHLLSSDQRHKKQSSTSNLHQDKTEADIEKSLSDAKERSRRAQEELVKATDALRRSRQKQLQEEIDSIERMADLAYMPRSYIPSPHIPLYLDPLDPLLSSLDPYLHPYY